MHNQLLNITPITEFNNTLGVETLHPSVSLINLSTAKPMKYIWRNLKFYVIFIKNRENHDPLSGKHMDGHLQSSVICLAPGQTIDMEILSRTIPMQGWLLCFEPKLVHSPPFRRDIREYLYFSYGTSPTLCLSEQEHTLFIHCFDKIRHELVNVADRFSKRLIVTNIELLLDYCLRFYERQLFTKSSIHHDILTRFELLLDNYLTTEKAIQHGLPTVKYCATEFLLSPGYFSFLVKRETGKSAQEYIQFKVMNIAKERILHPDKTISQIAYELGFQYPQHFTRLFKKVVGQSPCAYRQRHDEMPF